jgi:hypothetical protein
MQNSNIIPTGTCSDCYEGGPMYSPTMCVACADSLAAELRDEQAHHEMMLQATFEAMEGYGHGGLRPWLVPRIR